MHILGLCNITPELRKLFQHLTCFFNSKILIASYLINFSPSWTKNSLSVNVRDLRMTHSVYLYRGGNWNPERLSDLSRVTQLVSGSTRAFSCVQKSGFSSECLAFSLGPSGLRKSPQSPGPFILPCSPETCQLGLLMEFAEVLCVDHVWRNLLWHHIFYM